MKTAIAGFSIAAMVLAGTLAAQAESAGRIRAPAPKKGVPLNRIQGSATDAAEPLSKLVGTKPARLPIAGISIGKGPCGAAAHEPASQFPLASINDIFFCTSWLSGEGTHLQTIEILAPDGSCYQKIETPFEMPAAALRAPAGQKPRKVLLEGRKIPVDMKMLVQDPATGLQVLETSFPVSGSYVTGQSLEGNWSVNVYLDQERGPVASGTFDVIR